MSTSAPPALLVDCDGTLIDTDDAIAGAWLAVQQEFKCENVLHRHDWTDSHPLSIRRNVEAICDSKAGLDPKIVGFFMETTFESLIVSAPVVRDVVETVNEGIAQGRSIAVVSSSSGDHVRRVLEITGIDSNRLEVIAAEDVVRPKPDPQSYALALKQLGVVPRQAVALEDSPTGLVSATKAGVVTAFISRTGEPPDIDNRLAFLAPRPLNLQALDDAVSRMSGNGPSLCIIPS